MQSIPQVMIMEFPASLTLFGLPVDFAAWSTQTMDPPGESVS